MKVSLKPFSDELGEEPKRVEPKHGKNTTTF